MQIQISQEKCGLKGTINLNNLSGRRKTLSFFSLQMLEKNSEQTLEKFARHSLPISFVTPHRKPLAYIEKLNFCFSPFVFPFSVPKKLIIQRNMAHKKMSNTLEISLKPHQTFPFLFFLSRCIEIISNISFPINSNKC